MSLDDLCLGWNIYRCEHRGWVLDIRIDYIDYDGRNCNVSSIVIPIKKLAEAIKDEDTTS